MKKIFSIFCMAFIWMGSLLQAQTVGQSYTEIFDNLFVNVNKNDARTGILYDRVVPFSKLTDFNISAVPQNRTADAYTFIQGFDELWRAAFLPSARLPITIEELTSSLVVDANVIPIGTLHFRFNCIDSAVASQKLYLSTDSLIAEDAHIHNSLFKENTIFMASPLVGLTSNADVIYTFTDYFQFDNTLNPIVKFQIDFGDGQGFVAVNLNSSYMVHYADTGEYILRFIAIFRDRSEVTAFAKIKYYTEEKSKSIGSGWPYIDKLVGSLAITAQIDFIDYQGHNAGRNQGNVWIYYANADKKLRKPILIVDGFDPGNKRNFESCIGTGKSIWEQLNYVSNGSTQNLGKYLLQSLGYDLVILDLPDGGGYIEKNAMVCIETINYINNKLKLNGSKEQIVVVGPSMGGQITRFAMAYMEQNPNEVKCNYGKHNCRLWVSYDSPHQGANISYGAQEFLDYWGNDLGNQAAKKTWNDILNCVAAKQMLIFHKGSGAQMYHDRYYNRLSNVGYPNALRKIAISNGSLNNTANGAAGTVAFEAFFPYVVAFIDSKIRRFPASGQTVDVLENFWLVLGIFPAYVKRSVTAPNNGFCGIDGAPGGTYNTFDQIVDNLPASVIITNAHNHCFMPVRSTLDVSGNPNYCTNYAGRNLVNEGVIPFASYCNTVTQNMAHVSFNPSIVSYLTNEIETYIQGKDSISVCDEVLFTMHLPANQQNAIVTWECSNNLLIVAGQGTSTIVVKCLSKNSNSWVSATSSNLTYNKKLAKYNVVTMERETLIPSPNSYMITQNTIWSDPLQLNENVIVFNGAKLTVSTNLYLNPNISIIVKQGGLLELNGALLTNSCGNILWEGIVVEGNGNGNHHSNGKVHLLNGSVIKNANCGIRTGGSTQSGFILGHDISFINNKQAVVISSLLNNNATENNSSVFEYCNFIAEENSFIDGNNPNKQVELLSVKGVNFRACNFINHNSRDLVTGIFAANSGFFVNPICEMVDPITNSCVDGYSHQSYFNGFDRAIEAIGTATNASMRVVEAVFQNNNIGIETNAVDNIYVVKSEFSIGNITNGTNFGIISIESTGFTIEENKFYALAQSTTQNYGISVKNSGANNNQIYRNEFSNLFIAQQFVGQNRGNNSYLGLQTLCNTHQNNLREDIYVGIDPDNASINGIRAFQGGAIVNNFVFDIPAGNVFSSSVRRRVHNNTESSINYQYNNSHNEEIPIPSVNVVLNPVSAENDCPSHFNTGGGDVEVVVVKTAYENANRLFKNASQACQSVLLSGDENKIKEAEQQLAITASQRDYILNQYLQCLLNDSVNHSETINQLLAERSSYSDLLSLAERAIVENRFDDARYSVNLMYSLNKLTPEEREGISDFMDYIIFREYLHKNEKNIYELKLEEIDQLVEFSRTHSGRGKVLVDNILCYLYQICNDEHKGVNHEDEFISSMPNGVRKSIVIEENTVIVSPNPTETYCKFEWNFKEIKGKIILKIHDNSGKLLINNALNGDKGEWTWNVNSISSGDYFYSFYHNNQLLTSGIIVVK
ncbi:MAG: hypothetical protein LBU51_07290 [Bacteroidales bacterium]|jgi:hypothetical protein|nr:hypothetical protein [Bacteroidales bacterium]